MKYYLDSVFRHLFESQSISNAMLHTRSLKDYKVATFPHTLAFTVKM